MSVKFTNHTPKVRQEGLQKASRFIRVFEEDAVNISLSGTPKKTGDLRRSHIKSVQGLHGRVRWLKKYAARLEKVRFKNYTTPGTGPNFALNAMKKTLKNQNSLYRKA